MDFREEEGVTQALYNTSAEATRDDSNDADRKRLNNRNRIEELGLPGSVEATCFRMNKET